MEELHVDWSFDEFKAYLLMEAANADMDFATEEVYYIVEKVGKETYIKIKEEFDKDSDYQRAKKLQLGAKLHCTTKECKASLKEELMGLIKADHEIDVMERNLMLFLKKIIQ